MYHHFKFKKELVLAMIKERLFIKMDSVFTYEIKDGQSVTDSFRRSYLALGKNKMLVTYGCPVYSARKHNTKRAFEKDIQKS